MKRDNQNGDDDSQNEGNNGSGGNGGGGGGGGGGRPNKRFRGNDETIRLLIPSRVSKFFLLLLLDGFTIVSSLANIRNYLYEI